MYKFYQNFYLEIFFLFDDREIKWGLVNEIDGENFLMIIIVEDIIKIEILEDFFFFQLERKIIKNFDDQG